MATPPGQGSGSVASPPTCYRHPGRETYVSCVRCGRYACPDCLRSAAVGQQCVECVRQANKGSRQAVGMFGGRVSATPVVTYTLIALNVFVYLAELANQDTVITNWAMVGRVNAVWGVADGQWWRLITSAFVHSPPGSGPGILHILLNMWALFAVGPAIESLLGRARFLSIYLVSALAGSVLFYLVAGKTAVALGASGAIFGLLGAWLVLSRRLRMNPGVIVGWIVINLVLTFTVHVIAWQAHIGGLVAGAALTAAYVYAPRQSRTLIQVGVTVGIVALLLVGVVLRDQAIAHQVIFTI